MSIWTKWNCKLHKARFFIFSLTVVLSGILSACGQERILHEHAPISSLTAGQKEFDRFCRTVFYEELLETSTLDLHYLLTKPEAYKLKPQTVSLGECSLSGMAADIRTARKWKERLADFDRSSLTDDQKIRFDGLSASLESTLLSEGLELYHQPLAPTIGIQAQLPILLAEYSFHTLKDVEDYLSLLSQLDSYYAQILNFEAQKAAAGLGPSDASINAILESLECYMIDPDENFLTEAFQTRIEELKTHIPLSDMQEKEWDIRHRAMIREHFIPAYCSLRDGLNALKGKGKNEGGLCGFKDGKKYYEYLLKSGPGVSYTPEELKTALSERMIKDYEAIRTLISKNPTSDFHQERFSLTDPEEILSDLKLQMSASFPALSDYGYEIRYVPKYLETALSPAFYLTAPIDEPDRNIIYINKGYSDATKDLYTTLAHEGFPGHLYQTVYSRSHSKNPLDALLSCSGANEGWATYAENYACSFHNGLSEIGGRYRALVRSFSLCVHGLLDIGINYDGWTKDQAKQFIRACFYADDSAVDRLWQTMIDNPTNYLEYCGGYIEYTEMAEQAKSALGDRFSPLEFHTFLLDLGPLPFSVIRTHFEQWLRQQTLQAVIDFHFYPC